MNYESVGVWLRSMAIFVRRFCARFSVKQAAAILDIVLTSIVTDPWSTCHTYGSKAQP